MLHLLNRADANDQDVAKFLNHYSSFLGSYSKNIAALCRRLEALERKVNLRKQDEDVEGAQFSSVADTSQRITDYAAQAGLTVEDWAKAFNDAPEQRQATPAPAPETPAEALAVRPLLERVAQLGDAIGRQTVAQVQQLANQAAVWLRENPPGQLVAIEPRGCPTPGACSCVEPTLQAPEPGEAKELHPLWYLIEFLEGHSSVLRRTDPMDELAQVLSDSATLLKRLASPAYLVVGRPPEGCLEPLKSESGQVEACTAGVSIELLGDAPRPTYLDAIRLAEGCHDYSGGYSGPEGDAWHNAINTVVDVLKRAAVKPWDSQTRAVFGVGAEAQDVEA